MSEQPFRAKPCPTCGAGFPASASHGVITCENGHGWTVALAGVSDAGETSREVVPATDDQAALDRAAADMAVRDELAREVARAWRAHLTTPDGGPDATARLIRAWDALGDALDRLAAAYGEDR